jgi:hypothetical protein
MNTVIETEAAMQFILNGRTFNTATSQTVAVHRGTYAPDQYDERFGSTGEVRFDDVLYRTSKGAFFVHEHETWKLGRGGKPVVKDSATEMSPEQAIKWIEDFGASIVDASGLSLPDEA